MELNEFVQKYELPKYRIKQLYLAKYREFIGSYEQLSTWSKELRNLISQEIQFSSVVPVKSVVSADGLTHKILFSRKSDGKMFETVIMNHDRGRTTVCVSSMIGCPVGCTFCATGKMGFVANLKSEEIVDQILYFARVLKTQNRKVTNVVYMGMGEPLLNLSEVEKSIDCLTDPERMGFSDRRITVSTSGITPNLKKFISDGFSGRIALSLHAPNQGLREKLMPIAVKYPLPEILSLLKDYAGRTKKRISYEYALIDGINDSRSQAAELAHLVGRKLSHVNLIPYNPVPGNQFRRSAPEAIRNFSTVLTRAGIKHTLRLTMGDDIKAACGQLAVVNLKSGQI